MKIHEPFIEIIDRKSNMVVVTVIELVSPTNKYAGPGRESYHTKQREVLVRDTHLVEIDLLRCGPHVVGLDIRPALEQAYDAGSYNRRIDYSQTCQPPLTAQQQAWQPK